MTVDPTTHEPVDIVVVPRDRFSTFPRCLEALYAHTHVPFRAVVVAGGVDPASRSYLSDLRARRDNLTLVLAERLLMQGESRNLGLERSHGRLVVVMENDTIVRDGWLPPLLDCLRQESATVVAPLLWWHRGLHAAGGTFSERRAGEAVRFDYRINYSMVRRRRIDYPENHCILLDRRHLPGFAFDEVEPFDVDLGLTLRHRGLSAFLEPRSIADYAAPPPIERGDLPAFEMRWDWGSWEVQNARFERKWGVACDRTCKRASYRRQRFKFALAARYPNTLTVGIANLAFGMSSRIESLVSRRRWLRSAAARLFRLHATG